VLGLDDNATVYGSPPVAVGFGQYPQHLRAERRDEATGVECERRPVVAVER
jgi:hypothetical protein